MRDFLTAGLLCAWAAAAQPKPGGGAIEGHVVNALTRAPIRRATVVLMAAEIGLVAASDAEGKFEFTALPPGSYRLTASRTGFLERPARRLIAVGANERVTNAEIRLAPQSIIAGRVVDEAGEPVEQARVSILKQVYRNGRRLWGANAGTETNDRGEYRFSNLKPGRYLLHAVNRRPPIDNRYGSPPNALYVQVYYPNAHTQEQAVPVDVAVGAEVGGIDIRLAKVARPPSVRIRGKVTGLPADSPMVVSVNVGSGSMTVRAPDFAFVFNVPPGLQTIRANEYSAAATAWGSESILVAGEMDGIVVPLRPGPVMSGRIRVAEEGAQVKLDGIGVLLTRLEDFPTVLPQDLRSDASGRFVSRPVRPGHYALRITDGLPDGYFFREVRLGEQEVSPIDFEILAPGPLEIVLSNKPGRIAGSVVDGDGKAFAGPTVTLIAQDGRSWPAKQATDEAGGFQFTGLRPGKYTLFAWEEVDDDLWQDPEFRKKYAVRAVEIEVGAGEAQQVQLRAIAAEEMQ